MFCLLPYSHYIQNNLHSCLVPHSSFLCRNCRTRHFKATQTSQYVCIMTDCGTVLLPFGVVRLRLPSVVAVYIFRLLPHSHVLIYMQTICTLISYLIFLLLSALQRAKFQDSATFGVRLHNDRLWHSTVYSHTFVIIILVFCLCACVLYLWLLFTPFACYGILTYVCPRMYLQKQPLLQGATFEREANFYVRLHNDRL